jgi:hypothetical protein
MATGTFQEGFTFDVNVTEGPEVAVDPTAFNATLVENQTASSHLMVGNTGDYRLDYGAQVAYPGATVTCYPMAVNQWTGSTDGTTITDASMVSGYNLEDGWFMFDVSGVPAGVTIVNIDFFGYVNNTYYPYWSMTPVTSDPLTTPAATLYADINAEASTGYYLYQNEASTYTTGWKQYTLGGTANADLAAAVTQGWFAMGMASRDNSTTYFIEWDGWNETNVPYIEVTYATGPVNWLTLDGAQAVGGSVLAGDPANDHLVGFDATGIAPGTYTADIIVASNDFVTGPVTVPVSMTVVAGPGYGISGFLTYNNTLATPMDNVTVSIMDGIINMGSSVTDVFGAYSFAALPDGNFMFDCATGKARGGTGLVDVVQTRQFLLGQITFTPLQQLAADVSGGGIGLLDVVQMRQFLLGQITDALWTPYHYFDKNVTISGGNVAQDLKSLCGGDPDKSYTPPAGK